MVSSGRLMATSDGIRKRDWDQVHSAACRIANVPEGDRAGSRQARERMFATLDALEQRYGAKPSILATRADYTGARSARLRLFLRAYKAANEINDAKNLVLIARSLVELFIDDCEDYKSAAAWLERLSENLQRWSDAGERREARLLAKRLQTMRSKSRSVQREVGGRNT